MCIEKIEKNNFRFNNLEYDDLYVWDIIDYTRNYSDEEYNNRNTIEDLTHIRSALSTKENIDYEMVYDYLEYLVEDISKCLSYKKYKCYILDCILAIYDLLEESFYDVELNKKVNEYIDFLETLIYGKERKNESNKTREIKEWFVKNEVYLKEEREIFRGVIYPSMSALAKAHGVFLNTYLSRLFKGWTKEEALGIVLRIDEDVELADIKFEICSMQPGVRRIFEENIYCVLGIPTNASRVDILSQKDKLEKYYRIGELDSYNSTYDMPNIQKPNRDLRYIQVVLSKLGRLDESWLWFENNDYIKFWNSKIIDRMLIEQQKYDEMLAAYYNVLISDPYFNKITKWNKILNILDIWLNKTDEDLYRLLANHIDADYKKIYNYKVIVNSFKNVILLPLQENVKFGDISYIINASLFWKKSKVSFSSMFTKMCADRVMELVNDKLSTIIFIYKTILDNNHPYNASVNMLSVVTEDFLDNDYHGLLSLVEALYGYEIYFDFIKKKIKKTLWNAGDIVLKSGNNSKAARIFSSIYIFCDDEEKEQIKDTFSIEELVEIPENEFTNYEVIKIADAYEKKYNNLLAIRWYRVGAERGEGHAEYKLGEYYEEGLILEKNLKLAYDWYCKAAEHGDISARRKLAPIYYKGSEYLKKNINLAKEYWISVYIEYPCEYNAKNLNRYFPGWETDEDEAYDLLKNMNMTRLEQLAEKGIAAAAYWLGEKIYSSRWFVRERYIIGDTGFGGDINVARRWFLRAAIMEYSPAYDKLDEYYDIDATEAYSASEMFKCGVKYSKDKSIKGKDLTFYWYRKAFNAGYEDACNNLGVCYNDAIGTELDYKTANELYLRAIKYNENSGSYYNYGMNLYYGRGVEQNKVKAKDYLLKACVKKIESANKFLIEHYGILDGSSIDFDENNDCVIFDNDGVYIEFCGLKKNQHGFKLFFWLDNKSDITYNIWVKTIKINSIKIGKNKKIGECEVSGSHFETVSFKKILKAGDIIEFTIEINDENGNKICTIYRLKIFVSYSD